MNFTNWYTDLAEIWRIKEIQEGALTRQENRRIGNIHCRLTRVSGSVISSRLQMSMTAAALKDYYILVCDIAEDVQTGDELHLVRGVYTTHGKTPQAERYFAGGIQEFYEPAGLLLPHLAHKEINLTRQKRG